MKKILFTGEQGNLARNIAAILPRDQFEVLSPDAGRRVSNHHPWPEVDILNHKFGIIVKEVKPDIVVHSAAVVNTDKCAADPRRSIDVNLLGTHCVLEACEDVGAKLVFFSTTATYDPGVSRPYTEFSAQRPPTLYGITKYAAEMLVTGQHQVPNVVIRPCFIYGDPPHDHSSQLCRIAVHSLLKATWPEMAGPLPNVTLDPDCKKDYMRVEDFASAVASLLGKEYWGEIFNVSYGFPHPMGWYFMELEKALGVPLHMAWSPESDYMGDHVVSSSRLRACTEWEPAVPPEDGIRWLAESTKRYVAACKAGTEQLLYI